MSSDDTTETPAKVTQMPRRKEESEAQRLHDKLMAAVPTPQPEPLLSPRDLLLPSPHTDFVALMENELHNRIHGLQSGIAALEGVLDGKRQEFDAAIKKLTEEWDTERSTLTSRIDNLKKALRMAKSGVAAKDVPE